MKKLLMSVALVAAVAAGYMMTGSNESELNMSDLASANVEALADDDKCPNGCLDKVGKFHCYKDYDYKETGEAILE